MSCSKQTCDFKLIQFGVGEKACTNERFRDYNYCASHVPKQCLICAVAKKEESESESESESDDEPIPSQVPMGWTSVQHKQQEVQYLPTKKKYNISPALNVPLSVQSAMNKGKKVPPTPLTPGPIKTIKKGEERKQCIYHSKRTGRCDVITKSDNGLCAKHKHSKKFNAKLAEEQPGFHPIC